MIQRPVRLSFAILTNFYSHIEKEPYLSFWITIKCFFLAGLMYVIPLDICFLWSCRIAAWGFLGPWMKLVDMYGLVQEDEEKDEQKRQKHYEKMRRQVRLDNEKGAKLKAMKEYLFGQYVTEVPMVALERFNDVPLPSSSSQPFHKQRGLTLAVREYVTRCMYFFTIEKYTNQSTFWNRRLCSQKAMLLETGKLVSTWRVS